MDDRNEAAHPNGNIFYRTQYALDGKITEILRVVNEIQTRAKPVIEQAYREFLLQSYDPDGREYPDAADQIREVLIHDNYMYSKTSIFASASTLLILQISQRSTASACCTRFWNQYLVKLSAVIQSGDNQSSPVFYSSFFTTN